MLTDNAWSVRLLEQLGVDRLWTFALDQSVLKFSAFNYLLKIILAEILLPLPDLAHRLV